MPALDWALQRNGKCRGGALRGAADRQRGVYGPDRAAVQRHIEELRRHGGRCPDETPVLYPKPTASPPPTKSKSWGLAHRVRRSSSSWWEDRILVGAGSDHTDRDLEKASIEKAKLVCPNVLSAEVWDPADVREGWDDLVLRSYVSAGGNRTLYPEGRLGVVMTPDDLLALVRDRTMGEVIGTVIYSGTFALLGPR